MSLFNRDELEQIKNVAGKGGYARNRAEYKLYEAQKSKLRQLATSVFSKLNLSLEEARNERINKQAGQGASGANWKDYVLVGYNRNKEELNKMLFVKFALHDLGNVPFLTVETDTDRTSKLFKAPDQLINYVDSKKNELRFHKAIDFSLSLEEYVELILEHTKKSIQLLDQSYNYYQSIGRMNLTSHNNEIKTKPYLNQILFGPPGTGKTYKLNVIKHAFIDKSITLINDELTFDLAINNSWWKIIAAILYKKGPMKVPDIVDHPMIQAKHNPDKPTKANQIVWSQLQLHTKKDNENVNHVRRHDPLIFDKDEDSNWSVDKQAVEKELTEIKSLAEEIENIDKQIGKTKSQERFKFVTFHQSFSYEDFVEGIKPVLSSEEDETSQQDEIAYKIEKGVFYEACLEALRLAGYKSFTGCFEDTRENKVQKFSSAKPYALFIDEINRGNVSSIFGELITLIESDKRIGQDQEIWVNLPYDKSIKFAVPPNLHIIGTMNTADRSIEALDTALRRRFSFEEVRPDPSLLAPHFLLWRLWQKDWDYKWEDEKWIRHETSLLNLIGQKNEQKGKAYEALEQSIDWDEGLKRNVFEGIVEFDKLDPSELLSAINERIELLIDRDHLIGHSYFFSLIGADNCEVELMSIFYDKIIPLLEEYFYGDFGKIGLVLGHHFVDFRSGKKVRFADFKMNDQSLLQDKNLYLIKDYRHNTYELDFISAVRSIYEVSTEEKEEREEVGNE